MNSGRDLMRDNETDSVATREIFFGRCLHITVDNAGWETPLNRASSDATADDH